MKLATNMKEMKQNFRFNDKFLSDEDKNVYEELFASQMKKLALDIEDSQIHYDTFYITGQSGNGKSTALNHLKNTNEYIKNNFKTRHIMANNLFDFQDKITIVDVLLMVAMDIIEIDKELQKENLKKLEDFKELSLKNIEKSISTAKIDDKKNNKSINTKVDVGFLDYCKIGMGFKKEWNSSEQTRIEFRKLFHLDRRKLLDLLNEIIKAYNNKNNKQLLLIIDDLEKKNISNELFATHRELLENIEIIKIITIPVNYATSSKVYKLNLRINDNPLLSSSNDDIIEKNITILKNIIYKRIDEKHHSLMPNRDDVIGKIIKYSGCNIRQLLRLVAEASANARYNEANEISELDVDEAIQDLVNNFVIGIHNRKSFLKDINKNNQPQENENEKFQKSISDNMIFAYFNSTPWYEVNPIIKKYIEI